MKLGGWLLLFAVLLLCVALLWQQKQGSPASEVLPTQTATQPKALSLAASGVPHHVTSGSATLRNWDDDRSLSISHTRPTLLYFGEQLTKDPDKLKQSKQIELLMDDIEKDEKSRDLPPGKRVKLVSVAIDIHSDPAGEQLIETYNCKKETPRQLVFDADGKPTWSASGVCETTIIKNELKKVQGQ